MTPEFPPFFIPSTMAAFQAAWLALSVPLRRTLESVGATQPGVLRRLVAPGEAIRDVLEELARVANVEGLSDEDREHFVILLNSCDAAALRQQRQLASLQSMHIHSETEARAKRLRMDEHEAAFHKLAIGRGDSVPAPPRNPTSAPTTTTTSTRTSGAIDIDTLREKCVANLHDILVGLNAPVLKQLGETASPQTLTFLAAGRRARTLRTRLRGWAAFARWLQVAHCETWPSSWTRVAEFLEIRAAEPCSRAVVKHVFQGIKFIQDSGGFEGEAAVTEHKMLRRSLKELEARLGARAGGRDPVQAPRPMVSQLEALERMVMNVQLVPWLRAYAWWQALKHWGVLRHDDHAGIRPEAMILDDTSLDFALSRTKTSGPDKRTRFRQVGIHRGAFVAEPEWLATGYAIWTKMAPTSREYLLETPTPSLEECTHRQLRYHEAAAWSRRTLIVSGAVGEGEIAKVAASCYTEHSPRCFLPSAGLAVGFTDEQVKPLGGWSANSSRQYVRTVRVMMHQVQLRVAARVREARARGEDVLGDREEAARLTSYLRERGVGYEEALAHVNSMMSGFCNSVEAAEQRDPPQELELVAESDREYVETVELDEARDGERVPKEAEGYCISITSKTRKRRLHYVGKCYKVPGVDYAEYEWWGAELPAEHRYHAICQQCWKKATPASAKASGSASSPALAVAAEVSGGPPSDSDGGSTDDSSSSRDA